MKFFTRQTVMFFSAFLALAVALPSYSFNPLATDSRIRTYVYGENEVFKIFTEYGFQSNVEFGPEENILTISLGNPVAFKVTPAGNRLFIKALQDNRQTNMTIVTTERSYQFDISSTIKDERDIVYVARFFVPPKNFDATKKAIEKPVKTITAKQTIKESYNYNYSITGPEDIAPSKIFDNGSATFFKFPPNQPTPALFSITPTGSESPLVTRRDGNYVIVDRVLSQFAVRQGPRLVCVYNDKLVPPGR